MSIGKGEQKEEIVEKEIKEPAVKKTKKRGKSKVKELEESLSKSLEENARLNDTLLRNMADFENYKKRIEREFSELILNVNANFVKDILQILDELELSLKSSKENGDFESFYEGITLIYNKFLELLKIKGLKPIESIGKEFDVEMHEAVLQMEKEGHPPNIVIDEYQKGYLFNDRVLRHAKVVVSK